MLIALRMLGFEEDAAVTVSFMTIGFAKLWFVFNLRSASSPAWKSPVVRNPWLWGALALCTGLLVGAVYIPGLSDLLKTQAPGWSGWGVILGLSLAPFVVGQAWLIVKRMRGDREGSSGG
jgi:Ca2+-transporting ATPase